jgi:hypothetical protein
LRAVLRGPRRWALVIALAAGLLLPLLPADASDRGVALAARTPTPTPAPTGPAQPTLAPTPEATAGPTPETRPTATIAYPVPGDQPPDYEVPNGHFYSQAVPAAQRGFGFMVADAGGIPFWTEYQRLGGLQTLGYPISRRFAWGGTVAQAVQGGVLRWRGDQGRAELVPLQSPDVLPSEALQPEPPARLAAWAVHQPWSGWWWPATASVAGPHLFDAGGPLAKYDQYIARNGGDVSGTLAWEQSELQLSGVAWAGHCNGWAAAALLEEEPGVPSQAGGVLFTVADLKGLLSGYHFADAAAWLHGGENDLSPVDFHGRLVDWLGNRQKGMIVTFRPSQDEEVWSYPAYRFDLVMGPDAIAPGVTHVKATVWLADNNVPADFVGVRPWHGDGQTYEYWIQGPPEAPIGGGWEGASVAGRFAHPSFIWYPDPEHRNLDRVLASPNLNYKTIRKILRSGS